MMLKRLLRRDIRGLGAVEFALVAPVLISFVIGISQLGKLFFANADMKNAMAHGARAASVYPVPESDDAIKQVVLDRLARSSGVGKAQVDIVRDQDGVGNDSIDITMHYQVPLDFIFFDIGPVTLEDTRKVYIQMEGEAPANEVSTGSTTTGSTTTGGTTSTTTGGTTSTTSGGTTSSTSATSAGGTTSSTSATSASSTGGTTSTTSASTSSTTSASTTSSSGNGNSNGNSSHGHGNCNKQC